MWQKISNKTVKIIMKYFLKYYGMSRDIKRLDFEPDLSGRNFRKSSGLMAIYIDFEKFDMKPFIINRMILRVTLVFIKMMESIKRARKAYINELSFPARSKNPVSKEFWDEVVKKAESLGIGVIGLAPVEEDFMFVNDHSAGIDRLYENGIVLGMEMDFEAIETSPGPRAGLEALNIYGKLGIATNKLADFIRDKGHNAIACHPFGGPILYPAMAVRAGMGEVGKSGLLLTKKYGPRQRLAMVATDASPLPETPGNDSKITKFCEKCGKCVEACPGKAILDDPILKEKGLFTRIDSDKCSNYFYPYDSCSICIKVCPFHRKTRHASPVNNS